MSGDNKNYQNPFLSEEKNGMSGQPQGQPMPMYYPYPPMPPQAQQGENGQPVPMYYPYPPMPPQAQQGENGQPVPMYYPYPPMPPQAQQGENGQPVYYPYPPIPPQMQQGENGQPVYYPYPPMPPQAQQTTNQQPINNTYTQPQVEQRPATMPAVAPAPTNPVASNPQQGEAQQPATTPQQTVNVAEQEQDKKFFVKEPVINPTVQEVGVFGASKKEEDKSFIVHEPAQNETIYSAPTPVYDPSGATSPQQPVVSENNVVEEKKPANSFMSSMKSMYSAIGATGAETVKKESVNVSNEPLPSFTAPIETVTNNNQQQQTVYSSPVKEVNEPVEVDPSKFVFNQQSSAQAQPTQVQQPQPVVQQVPQPPVNQSQQQGFSLNQMLEQQEQAKSAPQVQEPQSYVPQAQQPQSHVPQAQTPQVQQPQVQQPQVQVPQSQAYIPQQPPIVQAPRFEQQEQSAGGIEITEMSPGQDIEKDQKYWEFMNNLLERFDDGKVHTGVGMNVQEDVSDAEQLQRRFQALETEAEPDQSSLENFGRNIEKPSSDRVVIPKTPSFFRKSVTDFDIENPNFEDDFDELEMEQKPRIPVFERVKKEKAPKAPKAPKEPKAPKASKSSDSIRSSSGKFQKILSAIVPMKGDSVGEIIRKVVVIVSVLVLLGCGIYFLTYFINQQQNKNEVEKYSQMLQAGEDEWSKIHSKYPNIEFPSGMKAKYADLYAINPDLVGWIKINGLEIELPVVQGENNSYYLKHNFNKENSKYGSIFVNNKNNIETLDLNTVVFGHRMHSDTQMFTNLREYATIEGFKKAPLIEFNTLYGDYAWKVYAVFITNGSANADNGNLFDYTFPNLATVENYGQFIAEVNQRKLYDTGVGIQQTDKILTLSTCTYEFDNARLVVIARQVRPGESTEVDTSLVAKNTNPRYPQAWYDEQGIKNPYKDFGTWSPIL